VEGSFQRPPVQHLPPSLSNAETKEAAGSEEGRQLTQAGTCIGALNDDVLAGVVED
jgi:hypothetical protein